ncbi:hypothetical protein HDU98_002110 [Podochytrium sp. JEL0797]|nr:hypothetical protein HDU98_002110 [Podochytrium sp. JEL0797]
MILMEEFPSNKDIPINIMQLQNFLSLAFFASAPFADAHWESKNRGNTNINIKNNININVNVNAGFSSNLQFGNQFQGGFSGGCCVGSFYTPQPRVQSFIGGWHASSGFSSSISSSASFGGFLSSNCFGRSFSGYSRAANLDPEAGQMLSLNVSQTINGLPHTMLSQAPASMLLSTAQSVAEMHDVPVEYIASLAGGMAEALTAANSTAAPQFRTYASLNTVVADSVNSITTTDAATPMAPAAVEVTPLAVLVPVKGKAAILGASAVAGLFVLFI